MCPSPRARRISGGADIGPARAVGRFLRDRSGTSAIEFAIVSLPFLGFVLLVFQVAVYHFALQSLDFATRIAARQVMVGSIPAGASTAATFKSTLLCPKFILSFDCGRVTVNAYKVEATSDEAAGSGIYRFVDGATKQLRSAPAGTSFCLGGPSDYVFLDVTYPFPNFVGSLLPAGAKWPDGFALRSTSFFRNEPFVAAAAAC